MRVVKGSTVLGDKVKDIVSGFTGIVAARTEYLNGCIRVGVQCEKLVDGKPLSWEHFDEPQVKVMVKKKVKIGKQETGGPRPDPQSR